MEPENFSIQFRSIHELQDRLEELLLNLAAKQPEHSEDERRLLQASSIIANEDAMVVYEAYDEL